MIILQDVKEKTPWDFTFFGHTQKIIDIKTADYTLQGLEDIVRIERKASTGELANNLGKQWARFEREMKRMKDIPHKYLICEFPAHYISSFPAYSGIPKHLLSKVRMNAGFMRGRLERLTAEYDIEILYCNDPLQATMKALEILTWTYDAYH